MTRTGPWSIAKLFTTVNYFTIKYNSNSCIFDCIFVAKVVASQKFLERVFQVADI